MVSQGFVAHTAQRVRSSPATMAMAGTPRGSRQHARTGRYECTWLYHTEAIVKGILGAMELFEPKAMCPLWRSVTARGWQAKLLGHAEGRTSSFWATQSRLPFGLHGVEEF